VRIKPLVVSKLNTAAQILLASVVLFAAAFRIDLGVLRAVLIWVTGGLTLVSLAAYLRAWLVHMSQETPAGGAGTSS
jgi:cardiolipin synthase